MKTIILSFIMGILFIGCAPKKVDKPVNYTVPLPKEDTFNEKYEKIYVLSTSNITSYEKKELVFFGELEDFNEINFGNSIVYGASGALVGAAMSNVTSDILEYGLKGMGVGIIFGIGKSIYEKNVLSPNKYMLVYDYDNKARMSAFIITHNNNEDEIKAQLEKELK